MDLQNVSNLVIPEGGVKAIHDKDGNLLWGRLAYSTKYAGNTLQNGIPTPDAPIPVQVVSGEQTVTIGDGVSTQSYEMNLVGKNLFDKNNLSNGWFDTNGNINPDSSWKHTDYIPIAPSTSYTTSGFANGSGINPSRCYYDSNKVFISGAKHNNAAQFVNTSPSNARYMRECCKTSDIDTLQIEKGSQATIYAPYYNYELCKIGDHQDYIYKSGDDWYVHKECGKNIYTGASSENWQYGSGSSAPFRVTISNSNYFVDHNTPPMVYTNYYTAIDWVSISSSNYAVTAFSSAVLPFRNTDISTLNDWKTWLGTHNLTVYYPLATPTDTKITDNTLISQLDAVHQFLTRYGYNATVSGNLPMIINKTNL